MTKTRTSEAQRRHDSQKSVTLTADDKVIILWLADQGFHHKRIAALFDVNQGRITDQVKAAREALV